MPEEYISREAALLAVKNTNGMTTAKKPRRICRKWRARDELQQKNAGGETECIFSNISSFTFHVKR